MSLKRIIVKSILVALCLAMVVVSTIFLRDVPKYFMYTAVTYFTLLSILYSAIDDKYLHLSRVLVFLIITGLIIVLGYIVLEYTGWMDKFEDMNAIKQVILDSKQWGVIVFLLLTIFQVVVLPIPAAVTILIGVAIYGPTWSFVLSTIGTIIGSMICFILGKHFGKKLVAWMIGEEKTEKYAEIINNKGKFLFIIMLLFPFFPDDMLCMCAGITSMTYRFFTIAMVLTRPIVIALTCYLGSGELIPFSGWGIPVWIAIFCFMLILFITVGRIKTSLIDRKHQKQ